MKKVAHVFCVAGLIMLSACGGKKESTNAEEFVANEAKEEKPGDVDVIAQGEALVKSNDCKTCHHATNKIIGPAHKEVAEKYEFTDSNVKMLAEKIIQGGVGVWGQVPMNAHVDLSQEDAEKMARYVLSLDGEKAH